MLADEQPSQLQWLLPSQLGTITDVAHYNPGTDTTTNINHLTYTSFGQIASQTNSSNEHHYTYTAREWDVDANLYYYRARWYDPVAGRFVSEDPIGFAGTDQNPFRYVKNRTLMYRDPTGNIPPVIVAGGGACCLTGIAMFGASAAAAHGPCKKAFPKNKIGYNNCMNNALNQAWNNLPVASQCAAYTSIVCCSLLSIKGIELLCRSMGLYSQAVCITLGSWMVNEAL